MKLFNIFKKYNYYNEIKKKSNEIYYKYNFVEHIKKNQNGKYSVLLETIIKEKLYNLILNMCNQVIYDYNYVFTKDEIFFIEEFEVDKIFSYIVEYIRDDVIIMKRKTKNFI